MAGISTKGSHCHLDSIKVILARLSFFTVLPCATKGGKVNLHCKRPRRNRHRPKQSRPNPLPEPKRSLPRPRLPEAVPHTLVPLLLPKPIALHLALDDIERIACDPQRLTRKATIKRDFVARDVFALGAVARHVGVHKVLEGEEPAAVGLRFTEQGDGGAAVNAAKNAFVCGEFADAVQRTGVEAVGAVGLCLEADPHVFDWGGEESVSDAGEGAGEIVLAIAELRGIGCVLVVFGLGEVDLFKLAARIVESAELDGDTGTDAYEGGEGAFVECEGTLVGKDLACTVEGRGVLVGGLEAHFDDI